MLYHFHGNNHLSITMRVEEKKEGKKQPSNDIVVHLS